MRVIYSILIHLFGLFLQVAALFNSKAKHWFEGRRGLFDWLELALKDVDRKKNPVVWFHVSSLGEFEQGRPVIEALRKRWPGKKILLTFFSPSGYEIRKNYEQADFVCYLPLDTPANVRQFLAIVRPEMVFFVKYDFWFNYMAAVGKRGIPLYVIAALFRKNQHFFQWYGGWFRKHLRFVTRFFVQNDETGELLKSIGIDMVTLTGDTRFDRVAAIASGSEPIPLVERFCQGKQVIVAGSTWEPDEVLLLPLMRQAAGNLKFILAPHDTSPGRIRHIRELLDQPMICFSELNAENAEQADILVIDSVGILSKLYRYATLAYIGGGFGNGIHNIQEPVTFGVPVLFGPNHLRFREAVELVERGGAFSVKSPEAVIDLTMKITGNPREHDRIGAICRNYVAENAGATEKIIGWLEGKGRGT